MAIGTLAYQRGWRSAAAVTHKAVRPAASNQIEGAYRFVSDTTTITTPQPDFEQITDAEWKGTWVFADGYYSTTRERPNRAPWGPGNVPDDLRGMGFDGMSGEYVVHGNEITLDYASSLYPGRTGFGGRFKFTLENGTLTMTEHLGPHVESEATGERVIVLKRIDNDEGGKVAESNHY